MSTSLSPSRSHIGLALLILLALVTALDAMAIDMYLPGMPAMAEAFDVPPGRIQQTLSVFLAGLAIGQGLYGPLLDRFGRRLPLLVGVGIFVLGSIWAALAQSVEALMVARFVQALGAAAGLVAPRAIVADLCDMKESARIFSLLMQVMMIAPVVAPLLGGFLLGHGGWRFIFWALASLGAIGLVWGLRAVPDSLAPDARTALSVGGVLRAYGRQLRHGVFMCYALAGGMIMGSLFTYISASAFVFTDHYALTPTQFSYVFAANSIALVIGGGISNALLKRGVATQNAMLMGMALHAVAGGLLFALTLWAAPGLVLYASVLAVAVGAMGLIFGNVTALTMACAGRQAGVASALMGVIHYLVAALIGYGVSLLPQGPATLPMALAFCGVASLVFSVIAESLGKQQLTPASA